MTSATTPQKISKMKSFAAIINGVKPLTTVTTLSISDVCEGPCYASAYECPDQSTINILLDTQPKLNLYKTFL